MSENATKTALRDALNELLAKKPLNKITIREITDLCGVNRMTFYYHFRDIYDLVEWSVTEEARPALEESKSDWQSGLRHIMESLREYRLMITNVYRCLGRERVENFLLPLLRPVLAEAVEREPGAELLSEDDQFFISSFYTHAFAGILLDWAEENMVETPEYLTGCMEKIMDGNLRNVVYSFLKKS